MNFSSGRTLLSFIIVAARVRRRQDSIRTRFLDTPPLLVLHVEYLSLLPRTRIYNPLVLSRQGRQPRPIPPPSSLACSHSCLTDRRQTELPCCRSSPKHIRGPVFPLYFLPACSCSRPTIQRQTEIPCRRASLWFRICPYFALRSYCLRRTFHALAWPLVCPPPPRDYLVPRLSTLLSRA